LNKEGTKKIQLGKQEWIFPDLLCSLLNPAFGFPRGYQTGLRGSFSERTLAP
jgi:hypothetical protein